MSSDVLSENWDPDKAGTTFRDLELQKWQEKANGCPAKINGIDCVIVRGFCKPENCFARYWGMI